MKPKAIKVWWKMICPFQLPRWIWGEPAVDSCSEAAWISSEILGESRDAEKAWKETPLCSSQFASWWLNQPIWKKKSNWKSCPILGVKIENIWSHHLVFVMWCDVMWSSFPWKVQRISRITNRIHECPTVSTLFPPNKEPTQWAGPQ